MKHTKKYIAVCLATALGCLAVLTACSGSGSSSQTQSSGASTSQAASGSTSETAAQETVMGEVTYVGSNYISVTAYTGGEEVTDFTTLDVSGLTASEETESIDTTEATEYLKVESGMLNAAAREDIATGAFIVSTFDEEGNHQIILIESGAADTGDEAASGSGATEDVIVTEDESGETQEAASDTAENGSGETEPDAFEAAQTAEESDTTEA